jgi:two-component system cell cycle sensor histidine kinase/response regulator CckA
VKPTSGPPARMPAAELLAAIVESADDVILSKTLDGIVTSWNRAAERAYGYAAAEMIGQSIARVIPPDRPTEMADILACIARGERIEGFETVRVTKDGRRLDMAVTISPVRNAQGGIVGASTIARDISAALRDRAVAEETQRSFQALFQANPIPMWVYDRQTLAFLEVNGAAVEQYGFTRDEFLAMRITDVRPAEDVERLLEDVERDRDPLQVSGLWRHRRRDGSLIDVRIRSHTLVHHGRDAVLVAIRDVTTEQQLEAQLRQTERLESIGQLAGGVAHDFNNLMTAILGFGGLLRDSLAPNDPRREDADQVLKAADRAAALTRQLLAFSRRQVLAPEVVDLNAVVGDLLPLLRRLLPESIAIETALGPGVPTVLADRGQLEQALVNLAVNARDAMPKGGRLTVETLSAELDEHYAASHAEVEPGPHALLAVSDTGHGMDAATRERIFEPFFTTKSVGAGTGLGLATVYGIVKQLRGSIFVYSEPGAGATFKLYFPADRGTRPEPYEPVVPAVVDSAPAGPADVQILLAEDDEQVRELAGTLLRRHGYTVTAVADPRQAVELVVSGTLRPDLLVSDLVMPNMSGRQLSARLRRRLPTLRVLFISGYTEDTMVRRGVAGRDLALLSKPFTAEALLQAVSGLLAVAANSEPPST